MAKANASNPGSMAAPFWRRRRVLLALGIVLVAALLGIWGYQIWRPRHHAIPDINLTDIDPEIVDAIGKARADVVQKPRSEEAWGKLAMVLHGNGFRDEAFICYGVAAELDEKAPLWPYLQGLILLGGSDTLAALPYLEKAAKLTPANSLPTAKLAETLLDLGRVDEAARLYETVLASSPGEAYAQFGLGQVAMTRKQYREALDLLKTVVDHPSCGKRARAMRVTAFERLDDPNAAEAERQGMAKLPEEAPWPDVAMDQVRKCQVGLNARLKLASQLAQQGKIDATVALLKSTVEAYPKSHTAWGFLGKGLGDLKDHAGSEQAFQKAIELAPSVDKAEHWYYLGLYRQEQKRFKEAAAAFRHTVELRPMDAEAHFSLGECLEAIEDRTGAAAAFRMALRHRPGMTKARDRLAKLPVPE